MPYEFIGNSRKFVFKSSLLCVFFFVVHKKTFPMAKKGYTLKTKQLIGFKK